MSLINKLPDCLIRYILEDFLDFKSKVKITLINNINNKYINKITQNEFEKLNKLNTNFISMCNRFQYYYNLKEDIINETIIESYDNNISKYLNINEKSLINSLIFNCKINISKT